MNFYLIFHHNLAFSSIPEEHYTYLIDSVYSHFLDLVEDGCPFGLEFTGETLEIINKLRPQYLKRLRKAWMAGHCEVIGSSYSQAIFPLIPAEVNRWNLKFGHEVYKKLLGRIPTIAYLNEQVYSESLPALYREFGIEAIVFDWMSAAKTNNWPQEYRYTTMCHSPSGMKFLWSDSIAFQKLQRAVWGDIEAEEWLNFIYDHQKLARKLLSNGAATTEGSFCLYASDAEVFDYYPGRLTTGGVQTKHFKTLRTLLSNIQFFGGKLVLPGDALERQHNIPTIKAVTSASYPLRTKKQDKYNVTRWAVTGREAARMNTQCFQLLNILRSIGNVGDIEQVTALQKELVALWGSDFRTHTIDEKYEDFHNRMGKALADSKKMAQNSSFNNGDKTAYCNAITNTIGETSGSERWMSIADDVSSAEIKQKGRHIAITTPEINLRLLKNRGLAVQSLVFSKYNHSPLVGTIPHGYFADIGLSSDFYSGHLVLVTQEGRQYTDLSCSVTDLKFSESRGGITIRNRTPMELPGLSILKTYKIQGKELHLIYDLYAKDLRPASLRLGIWTLHPKGFERDTLYYETHQGGDKPEKFFLGDTPVTQDTPVNPVVTASHCLGNTTGILRLGDQYKWFQIQTSSDELYSIPMIHHEDSPSWEQKPSFFNRVYYSICERDDVANVFWKGRLRISFCLTCGSD